MKSQGIDYGRGLANVDKNTGIRFGVISQHSLMPEALDDFEADYGPPTCQHCGNEAVDNQAHCDECEERDIWMLRKDYHCHGERCAAANPTKFDGAVVPVYCFDSDRAFGDEPVAHYYDKEGYKAHFGNDGFGVWVEESPYYTYARFCSPCAPGAGDLDSPIDVLMSDGSLPDENILPAKVYCFGHDWFEGGKAPYRVFQVVNDEEVFAEGKEQ